MPGRVSNVTMCERKLQSKEFIQIRCQMRKVPAGMKASDYWAEGTSPGGNDDKRSRKVENADLKMAEKLQNEAEENERNLKRLLMQEIRHERELLR